MCQIGFVKNGHLFEFDTITVRPPKGTYSDRGNESVFIKITKYNTIGTTSDLQLHTLCFWLHRPTFDICQLMICYPG